MLQCRKKPDYPAKSPMRSTSRCSTPHRNARAGHGLRLALSGCGGCQMSTSFIASRRLDTAYVDDLYEDSNDADDWGLADACRTPFAYGLVTLMPAVMMIGALLFLLHARPMLAQTLSFPV